MNVFFVFSPLQLVNALEAKAFFETKNNVLVVVREDCLVYTLSSYGHLLDVRAWDDLHYLFATGPESTEDIPNPRWFYLRWSLRRRLDRLIASLGPTETLFMGRYAEPIQRHIVNRLAHRTLYLLDDGTDTLLINDRRKHSGKISLSPKGAVSLFLLGLRNAEAERVTFFSAYDIDVRTGDTLVRNRYTSFRAGIAETAQGDEVWFLGQPLVADAYLTQETYTEYLAAAKAAYPEGQFVYVPHSREPEADVAELRRALGCEVRRYGLPIEHVLSTVSVRPRELVSLFTSALPNCAAMFGELLPLTAVYLEPQHLRHSRAFVESVYDYLRNDLSADVRVLTLADLSAPIPDDAATKVLS